MKSWKPRNEKESLTLKKLFQCTELNLFQNIEGVPLDTLATPPPKKGARTLQDIGVKLFAENVAL